MSRAASFSLSWIEIQVTSSGYWMDVDFLKIKICVTQFVCRICVSSTHLSGLWCVIRLMRSQLWDSGTVVFNYLSSLSNSSTPASCFWRQLTANSKSEKDRLFLTSWAKVNPSSIKHPTMMDASNLVICLAESKAILAIRRKNMAHSQWQPGPSILNYSSSISKHRNMLHFIDNLNLPSYHIIYHFATMELIHNNIEINIKLFIIIHIYVIFKIHEI